MKTYRIRDIRKYTGLSRKQIYDYSKSIKPIGFENDAKYKLYDREGLEKLSLAALLSELGAGPQRINDIFSSETFDKEIIINELINEAKNKIQDLEDIITVADFIKDFNIQGITINPLEVSGLHEQASLIRNALQSPDNIATAEIFAENQSGLIEIYKIICSDYDKFGPDDIPKEDYDLLIGFIKTTLGSENWARVFTGISTVLSSLDEYIIYVNSIIGSGSSDKIAEALVNYQLKGFFEEFEPYCTDDFDEEIEKRHYNSEIVRITLKHLLDIFSKWFGYRSGDEMSNVITTVQYLFEQEEDNDDYINNLNEAIQMNLLNPV